MLQDDFRHPAVRRGRLVMGSFFLFALAVAVFDHWQRGLEALHEAIVPLTGWNGLSDYVPLAFFAARATFFPSRRSFGWVMFFLALSAVFGGMNCYRGMTTVLAGPELGNPYLIYDPRRPLVTVLPPVVWMAVLWLTRRLMPEVPGCGAGGCGLGAKAAG
jgi:hypothetical protein